LPLNGRNFLDLGQLEPGVQVNTATFKGAYSMLGVAGQSGITTRVTVDGLDIQRRTLRHGGAKHFPGFHSGVSDQPLHLGCFHRSDWQWGRQHRD